MVENGGEQSPPFIKKEQEGDGRSDDDDGVRDIGNNMKGISIAERRAAKCGFNNAGSALSLVRSPYVTIPSGISPSALLDSPMVLLPNAQAQLSPTTGTFHQFPLSPNPESLKLKLTLASEEEDDDDELDDTIDASSHKPDPHLDSVTVDNLTFEDYFEYPREDDTLAKSDRCLGLQQQQQPNDNTRNMNVNPSNQEIKHHHQKAAYIPKEVAKHSEDGFYWRKYGQKHVKGSEFPRSYYKCTNANCLVKKKVERSHAGEITQIVYKGSHNHPIPQPLNNRRPTDMPVLEMAAGEGCGGATIKADDARVVALGPNHQWMPDHGCLVGAMNSSASILSDFPNNNPLPARNFDQPPVQTTAQDISSNTFGSQDGEDRNQASPESISYKDEDGDESNNAQSEPKKRKRENLPQNETTIPRSGRESKVVVQIESDVDILDDGYRWRKYGQKVVKGNPNPRSYYKCTTPRCPVRKHVERAADDIKSVLTTYEGKHNHDVPASKTGSLAISDASNQLQQAVVNNNIGSNSSPMAQKPDHASKTGKQPQDNLPLYMERKPILSYNDFMRSNLSGNFPSHHHDLGLGASPSLFPYSFPPFPSLAYNSLLMNGNNNHMKSYSSPSPSKFYQMMPSDYMPMPSQMSHHVPGGPHVPNMGGGFAFNNYTALQNPTRVQQPDHTRECQVANVVKPKEEQTEEDEGESFDRTRLSIPNHGNGSL